MKRFKKDVEYVLYNALFDIIYTCYRTDYVFPFIKDKDKYGVYMVSGTMDGDKCYEISPTEDVYLGKL